MKFWNTKRLSRAKEINLTPIQVSILASIVKKESSIEDERYGNLIDCALLLDIDIPEEFSKDYYRPEKIERRRSFSCYSNRY